MEAMVNMSPDMQELFKSVLDQKDPVQDSYTHEMEVQREIRKQNFEMGISEDEQDMRFSSESADDSKRSNARTLDWNGNEYIKKITRGFILA